MLETLWGSLRTRMIILFGLVDASSFSKLISDITYGRTGYAFAVDGTGKTSSTGLQPSFINFIKSHLF